ncbi:MAG: permease [Pirellulaceae bacterium]
MDSLFWGAVLRFCQALVQATPTILIGLIVAGVFRRLLGHAGTRRLFGDNTWRSLPQAWAVGMLLPVCSLGVIPVVREMRRAGVSGGAILAFGLTAPLFNPISVLYGLTLADPIVILTFSFCSLVIVTVVGLTWDKLFPNTATPEPEPPAVAFGAKRMLSIGIFGARELAGPSSLYISAGLLGVALLSVLLPQGYLQTAAEHDDPWAPLFMTAVAIPAYATPMTAMVQLASMFQHGNSVGAAFALLALGAGANIGLVAWMVGQYGVRRSVVWFALLFTVVVGLAYGVDKPLYPHGVEPAGHTHAFDIYCAPFQPDTQGAMRTALGILREKTAPHEIVSLVVASLFLLAGLVLARWDRDRHIESWLERQPEQQPRMDVVLPGHVLGGVALVGLVAFSLFGCYLYYPAPSEIFEEMRIVNTEVVSAASSQDWDTALYWIPIYDDWTRKLQVSMALRGYTQTPYLRAKANVLRDKLELLEHECEDQEVEEAREIGMGVQRAYMRMRTVYAAAE